MLVSDHYSPLQPARRSTTAAPSWYLINAAGLSHCYGWFTGSVGTVCPRASCCACKQPGRQEGCQATLGGGPMRPSKAGGLRWTSSRARAPGHLSLTQVSAPPVMSRTSGGGARWGAPSDTSDRTARLKPPPAPLDAPFAPAHLAILLATAVCLQTPICPGYVLGRSCAEESVCQGGAHRQRSWGRLLPSKNFASPAKARVSQPPAECPTKSTCEARSKAVGAASPGSKDFETSPHPPCCACHEVFTYALRPCFIV